ncbi:MAG: hypothetical protein GQE15_29970 [Archangiaceae bacterium]|nr:hypothetical protein [Archangiaceae bacterium]
MKDPKERDIDARNAHAKQVGQRQILIVACEGDGDITSQAAKFLKKNSEKLDNLMVVVDSDGIANRATAVAESFDAQVAKLGFAHRVAVNPLVWHPKLEAIVETALRSLNPQAMASVDKFIDVDAPNPSKLGKEKAYAYCAAWQPRSFGESFFGFVWKDEKVRAHLEPVVSVFEPQLLRTLGGES